MAITNLFFKFIKDVIRTGVRHLYWFYRLSRIKNIQKSKIEFPVSIEGKGKIVFGDGVNLKAHVNLGCGKDAYLKFGDQCEIGKNIIFRIGEKARVVIASKVKLLDNTRIYTNNNWTIGENVIIATNCAIGAREPGKNGIFEIGENTHIGDNTIIDLCDNITIGKEVAIGPNCTLYTHDHEYKDVSKPAWKGGIIKSPIEIMEGAWIGSGVTILPGVRIGNRAVIAASSVVTKDVPSERIWGGVPAKELKKI